MTMNHDVTTTEESTREDLPPTIQDIEGYPLSPQQKRLWSLHPDPAQIPVLTFEITVAGTLGTPVLDNALRELCHRHEILHTVFHPAPGLSLPLQVLVEPTPEIHHLDLGPITPEAREDTLREAREELARPFDPEQGPQWRALVWREAADAHRLLIAGSALVVDTGTGAVLVQALAEILSDAEPDEDLLQYAQFCDWQSDLVEGEEGEEARDFWRFETASQLEAAMLPGARRQARGRDRQRFEIPLDGDWLDAPEPPSEVEGGFDSFFLAAWQAVLARYGGDEGFAIGGVIDGRKYSELDVMPGPFSRAVPLRSRLTEARPLAEIAGKLARDLEESRDWLEGFLGEAGEEPARFAVGFESLDLLHRSETGDLTLTLAEVRGGTEPFALQLLCRRGPKGWKATIEYDQGIFDARSIERLARSWARILADAVRRPGVATGRLDWLAEQDRADLSASGPRREHPPRLVPDRFRDQARKTPNAIAVSDGERQLTYAELAEQARELADELAHRGIGAEQAVGLLMDRGVELVVGILGVLEAGAAYVPLDPEYPSQRLTYMADDSRLELVLTLERYLEAWELPQQALALDTPAWRAATNAADRGDDEASPRLTAGHLAYVLYTSGSTGRPKGVMISHGSLANYVDTVLTDYALTDGEAVPIHSSFSFDLTVTSLFPPPLRSLGDLSSRARTALATRGWVWVGLLVSGSRQPCSPVRS